MNNLSISGIAILAVVIAAAILLANWASKKLNVG